MEEILLNETIVAKFKESLRGTLIQPDDADYDEARKLYNGMIDKRPLAIARCANVADVIAAVNFGRTHKLPIAIRSGGHNGPGLGSVNDGLVIDLSLMKGVRVDPEARTARVDAGCTQGDVDHATHAFGLAPLLDGLPQPWLNWMGTMPYPAVQSMFDGLYPKGMQWYWRGDFVKSLPDAAIDAHIEQAANTPSELSLMHLYPIDGAVHRVAKGDTAWSCRDGTLVDGHCRHRPQPKKCRTGDAVDEGLLGGGAPLQSRHWPVCDDQTNR